MTREQLIIENTRLVNLLWRVGICSRCGTEIVHDVETPFADCDCGTSEDTSGPSLLQQLRTQLRIATTELEWIAGKDGGCPNGGERDAAISCLNKLTIPQWTIPKKSASASCASSTTPLSKVSQTS